MNESHLISLTFVHNKRRTADNQHKEETLKELLQRMDLFICAKSFLCLAISSTSRRDYETFTKRIQKDTKPH